MEICWSAKIVLVISILAILFDILFFGFYVVDFLQSIIFTAIIIFITNWSCYKLGYSYNLITWSIVIFHILLLLSILFLLKYKNTEVVREIIEAEKIKRHS